MKRQPFEHDEKNYDLSHLDPFDWVYKIKKNDGQSEDVYKFQVEFSDHTFTSSPERNSSGIHYDTGTKDKRLFDFDRYNHSLRLPEIIQGLASRKCFLTGTDHKNYFTVEIIDEDGSKRNYAVFFAVKKMEKRRGWIRLYVESAYILDEDKEPSKKRKIGFNVIARNTQRGSNINRRKR